MRSEQARPTGVSQLGSFNADNPNGMTLPDLWRVICKRKLLLLLCVFGLAVCGFFYGVSRGDRYTAEAQLEVQPGSAADLKQTISSILSAGADMDVTIESYGRVLRSDTLLFEVAKKLRLQDNPDFVAPQTEIRRTFWSGPRIKVFRGDLNNPYVRNAVMKLLKKRLKVERVPRTQMLIVSFSNKSPALAVSIVNTLLSEFIEHNFSTHFAARGHLVHWLSGQMDDLRSRVQNSQDKMVGLERKLGLLSLDPQHTLLISEIANLEKSAADATEQRVVSEARYKILSTMPPDQIVDSTTALGSDFPNNSLGSLRTQRATTASELAKLGPVYGPNYPSVRQAKAQLESLDSSIAAQQNRVLEQAKEAYELAQKDESKARGVLNSKTGEIYSSRDDLVQYQLVSQEFASDRHMYESILQRLQEATVDAGLDAADIEVVDLAAIPVEASSISPMALGTVGAVFGFLGALTFALLAERFSTKLYDLQDVQQLTGLPALGSIPHLKSLKLGRKTGSSFRSEGPELLRDPQSQFSESFRALRTTVRLSQAVGNSRIIMVTSCQPQEGKTTVSINMATALALSGRRVLLVDADMRRPAIGERLQLQAEHGLSDVLVGYSDMEQATYPMPKLPTLHVLPSGATPPLPSELLGCDRMARVLERARQEYDYVILDTPPLIGVTDSAILASQADGILLTVRQGFCNKSTLNRAGSIVHSVRANTLGFVFNGVKTTPVEHYGYLPYGADEA